MCALFLRSSNKKCGLNPALPKTCGLKNANISATATATNSIFCTTHHHWPGNLPLQFDPSPLIVVAPHSLKLSQISPFFKNSPFSGRALANPLFSPGPKIPLFNPQNSTYIRATDLQTSVLRSTDSVDSSDTLSFAISPKLGEL